MSRKPNDLRQYMRRASAVLPGFGAQKRAALSKIRTALLEIPHAETMSYEILCAAAETPEEIAAPHVAEGIRQERKLLRTWSLALLALALVLGIAAFGLGCAYGKDAAGRAEIYRPGDALPREVVQALPAEYTRAFATE